MRSAIVSGALILGGCITAPAPSITDPRDGQLYAVLHVEGQRWLGADLAFSAPGSFCYEDAVRCDGRLYPWRVALEACPAGWRLANEDDWRRLERHLGMNEQQLVAEGLRGEDQGAQLRVGGSSGFNAPIAGYRRPDASYARRGERSAYWLATPADETAAWHRDIRADDDRIYRSAVPVDYALSVRCVTP